MSLFTHPVAILFRKIRHLEILYSVLQSREIFTLLKIHIYGLRSYNQFLISNRTSYREKATSSRYNDLVFYTIDTRLRLLTVFRISRVFIFFFLETLQVLSNAQTIQALPAICALLAKFYDWIACIKTAKIRVYFRKSYSERFSPTSSGRIFEIKSFLWVHRTRWMNIGELFYRTWKRTRLPNWSVSLNLHRKFSHFSIFHLFFFM